MRKHLRHATLILVAITSVSAAARPRSNWIRCDSQHGTGTFWFDPYAHKGHLRLSGHGYFQGSYPISIGLECRFIVEGRRRWECLEGEPAAHPDGAHRVGIDISYGRYLPVATRKSPYGGWMVVDDFYCFSN